MDKFDLNDTLFSVRKSYKYFKKKVAKYKREVEKCEKEGSVALLQECRIKLRHYRNAAAALEEYINCLESFK